MASLTKSDLLQIFKEYGVVSKKDMPNLLQEYGVVSKKDMPNLFKEYGVATKKDLIKLERSLSIKITKSKYDLAGRIANVAIAKEEHSKVEKIEKRVATLENFQFV